MQFLRLRYGSTGHTGQLLVQAEEILVGDGSKRVVFTLHFDAFFSLDRLVETLAIAPPGHLSTGEFIDNHDLAIFDDVILVALEDDLGLNGILHVARQVQVVLVIDVFHTRQLLKLIDTCLCQDDGTRLLLNGIVDLVFQTRRPPGELHVHVSRFLALAGDDQRGTRLVNQDIIDFIDDGIVQFAHHCLIQ